MMMCTCNVYRHSKQMEHTQNNQPLLFHQTPTHNKVDLQVAPACSLVHPKSGRVEPMHAGRLLRTMTCELMYGPMNCDFVYHGVNAPLLDEYAMPQVMACGLNIPSPDLLTPERTKSTVWTWAPGHPFDTSGGSSSGGGGIPGPGGATWWRPLRKTDESTMAWLWHVARLLMRMIRGGVGQEGAPQCSAVRVEDGRWVAVPCDAGYPRACRHQEKGNSTWQLMDGALLLACDSPAVYASSSPYNHTTQVERALKGLCMRCPSTHLMLLYCSRRWQLLVLILHFCLCMGLIGWCEYYFVCCM